MTVDDINKLIPLCRDHFEAVNMADRFYTFNEETAKKTLTSMVNRDTALCLVSDDLQGICIFTVFNSPFDENDLKAVEFLWYSPSPKIFISLFEKSMEILKDIPVISIGISSKSISVKKYLEKKGFINTEISYARRNFNV